MSTDPSARDRELADLRVAYDVQSRRVLDERARVIDLLTAERHDREVTEAATAAQVADEQRRAHVAAETTRLELLDRAERAELDASQLRVALREREQSITNLSAERDGLQRHLDAVFASKTMRILEPARKVYKRIRRLIRR